MTFWEKLLAAVADTASSALSAVVEAIRTVFEGDPETRRKVAFSVAIIALSAKMAKADGIVSEAEVNAFRRIFEFPPEEAKNVARLYNLAADPTEQHDLSAAEPQRVAQLRAMIEAQNKGMAKPIWPGLIEGPVRIDVPLNTPWKDGQDYIYWTN